LTHAQWGNSNAISDITESAGWLVWGCQSNTTDTQAIQAICKSTDTSAAGCDHLDQNGAVDTIVRLPQSVSFCEMYPHSCPAGLTRPSSA
jgi:hypothetical protein